MKRDSNVAMTCVGTVYNHKSIKNNFMWKILLLLFILFPNHKKIQYLYLDITYYLI